MGKTLIYRVETGRAILVDEHGDYWTETSNGLLYGGDRKNAERLYAADWREEEEEERPKPITPRRNLRHSWDFVPGELGNAVQMMLFN